MVSTLIRQCKIDQMCVTALHSQLAYFCPLEQKKGRCVSGPGQWKDDQYIYIIYIYIYLLSVIIAQGGGQMLQKIIFQFDATIHGTNRSC